MISEETSDALIGMGDSDFVIDYKITMHKIKIISEINNIFHIPALLVSFFMAQNRIQPLLLPNIIIFLDGSMTVLGTISNNPATLTLTWVDRAILGNLIVIMPNALDCGSFITGKKFEANEIPEF